MMGKTWYVILKVTAYSLAILIILAAMIMAVAYFVTPVLDGHRQEFETYASQTLQTPVTIKHVGLSWYRYQPVISLHNAVLLNKETKAPVLKIKKISILFSIPRSIWYW